MFERDRPLADRANQLAVVRRHEDGGPFRVDLAEQVHDLEGEIGIEIARRLVREDERRLVDERPRDRDALLLAARQLDGIRVDAMLKADPLQAPGRPSSAADRPGVRARAERT